MLIGFRFFPQQARTEDPDFLDILSGAPSYCVSVVKNKILFLLASADDVRPIVSNALDKGRMNRYAASFSLPFNNLEAVFQQRKLIEFCLANASQGSVRNAKELALSYLVSEITSNIEVGSLLHPALEKLDRYDKANQSSLLETLRVYLNHDCNAQRCANELYLHRNSLQYRVRRIQEIADVSLDDPEERAYLRLSFLLS